MMGELVIPWWLWCGFVAGMFLTGTIGCLAMAIICAGARADERMNRDDERAGRDDDE